MVQIFREPLTKIKLFAARQLILPCWLELNCWSFGMRQSISTGSWNSIDLDLKMLYA